MVSNKWAGSALIALLSISSSGVLAAPAKEAIKERQLLTLSNRPVTFSRIPTLLTAITGITRVPITTTRSTTPIVYTTPVYTTPAYTTPAYTTPYGYTTPPPYGYTTPGTTRTTTTSSTKTSSTRTSATPQYTPVVGANNTCYNRLKIETLQRSDPDQFNMLLLAWDKLMNTPDSDPFGYYQIAGIHGAPSVPWQWGNVPPGGGSYGGGGYCTHHSVLFTTWHRPYLLLLEQALFHAAMAIANGFTGSARTQYLAAAGRVRLPYWDWSDPVTQSNLPPITTVATVIVTKPNTFGSPVSASINNPLFAYNFLSSSSISPLGSYWNTRMFTRRYPDGSGNDRSYLATSAMQSGFSGRVTQTYNAFMSLPYNLFSNRVEGIHDSIHGAVGGSGGHMGSVAVSAFDPIFWLHHCNIDRFMAMYQATQPSTFLAAAPAVGTYARPVPPNTIDDQNTELYPFMRSDFTWWRSTHTHPAAAIWGMKYGYPEVPCSYSTRTPAELDTFTTTQINTLYGPRRPTPGIVRDWQVRLVIDEGEIPGGYDIYVYGGGYGGYGGGRPEDPYKDPYRNSYIGSLSSMSPGSPDMYKQGRIRYVDVSLNSYLQNTSYYEADPYKITDYIQRDLYYTIIANDKPCKFEDLYTAKIAVYSRDYYYSGKEDVLPSYINDPYYYINVTERIPGGIKDVQDVLYPVRLDGTREKPWADFNSTSQGKF